MKVTRRIRNKLNAPLPCSGALFLGEVADHEEGEADIRRKIVKKINKYTKSLDLIW